MGASFREIRSWKMNESLLLHWEHDGLGDSLAGGRRQSGSQGHGRDSVQVILSERQLI